MEYTYAERLHRASVVYAQIVNGTGNAQVALIEYNRIMNEK